MFLHFFWFDSFYNCWKRWLSASPVFLSTLRRCRSDASLNTGWIHNCRQKCAVVEIINTNRNVKITQIYFHSRWLLHSVFGGVIKRNSFCESFRSYNRHAWLTINWFDRMLLVRTGVISPLTQLSFSVTARLPTALTYFSQHMVPTCVPILPTALFSVWPKITQYSTL